MNIKYQKISDLIPYVNNPRYNDDAVDAVAQSIDKFGFKVPIIVDRNNEIVAGHTRLKAAQKLGLEEVPTIIADDLDENQVRAFRLADNKVSELSTWNTELLEKELLNVDDIDMTLFGFDELIKDFDLQDIEEDNFNGVFDDEYEPTAKYGDVYQLGNHRVMCGDSTNKEDVRTLMNGDKAQLVVTDPPYNVAVNVGDVEDLKKRNRRTDGKIIQNDAMSDDDFVRFLTDAFSTMNDSMIEGGVFYIWHADNTRYSFETAILNNGLSVKQTLIWVKNSLSMGRQDYQWKHESCLYGWKNGASHYFINDRTQTTVLEDKPNINRMSKDELKEYVKELQSVIDAGTTIIREDKPAISSEHPTMKPIKLLAHSIRNSSKRGDIVLDLFGGSGSTLIACEQLDRVCYMMEYDPRYVDVIIKRWEEYTGEKAELVRELTKKP